MPKLSSSARSKNLLCGKKSQKQRPNPMKQKWQSPLRHLLKKRFLLLPSHPRHLKNTDLKRKKRSLLNPRKSSPPPSNRSPRPQDLPLRSSQDILRPNNNSPAVTRQDLSSPAAIPQDPNSPAVTLLGLNNQAATPKNLNNLVATPPDLSSPVAILQEIPDLDLPTPVQAPSQGIQPSAPAQRPIIVNPASFRLLAHVPLIHQGKGLTLHVLQPPDKTEDFVLQIKEDPYRRLTTPVKKREGEHLSPGHRAKQLQKNFVNINSRRKNKKSAHLTPETAKGLVRV